MGFPAVGGRMLGDQHLVRGGGQRASAPGSRSGGPSPRPRTCAGGWTRCCGWRRSPRRCGAAPCRRRSSCRCRHVVVDRADQPGQPQVRVRAATAVDVPSATSSPSSSGHSCRNMFAPVRLPSPRPRPASRCRARPGSAPPETSLARAKLLRAVPIDVPPRWRIPPTSRDQRSDHVATLDHALKALIDRKHLDATIQRRSAPRL